MPEEYIYIWITNMPLRVYIEWRIISREIRGLYLCKRMII